MYKLFWFRTPQVLQGGGKYPKKYKNEHEVVYIYFWEKEISPVPKDQNSTWGFIWLIIIFCFIFGYCFNAPFVFPEIHKY